MDINRQKFFICIALLCTLFLVTGCAGDKNYTTISTASSTTQAPTETEPASMGHLRLTSTATASESFTTANGKPDAAAFYVPAQCKVCAGTFYA